MGNWQKTRAAELLKIEYPIIQGPFGRGSSSALLAVTVSNAGGLGSYGANDLQPEQITKVIADIRQLTNKPFAVNLWVSTHDKAGESLDKATYDRVLQMLLPYYRELKIEPPPYVADAKNKAMNFNDQANALIAGKPDVFSFVFGIPSEDILTECRKKGIVTACAASTVDEAKLIEDAGVDIVVAAGFEGAGHRPSFLKASEESLIGNFALIPQIVDSVKIPVVAAGGIADGRGIAAALMLGAQGVQIGTAFLACDESGANALHRQALFQPEAQNTELSRSYTGRLARGISSRFAGDLKSQEASFAPYPVQAWMVAPLRAAALQQKRTDLINLWAGQAAGLVHHHKAGELFAALVQETNEIFDKHK